jgi:hypothetical protein
MFRFFKSYLKKFFDDLLESLEFDLFGEYSISILLSCNLIHSYLVVRVIFGSKRREAQS